MGAFFFAVTVGLYSLATVIYVIYLFHRTEKVRRFARIVLFVSFLGHLGLIGFFCFQGAHPLSGTSGLLRFTSWVLVGGCLLTGLRWKIGVLGAMIAPLALALLVCSYFMITHSAAAIRVVKFLGWFHLVMAAMGVAAFALAAAVAVVYLYQESALKKKRLDLVCRQTPALSTLDDVGRWLVLIGFPIFTLALLSGVLWVTQLPKHGWFRLEYVFAGLSWLVLAVLLVARFKAGLRGKRAAWVAVVGFLGIWLVLVLYVGRKVLGP
ncbi:MAG: cytochrome c biogenesis protein CcsA [Pseudomonadota bacterium]